MNRIYLIPIFLMMTISLIGQSDSTKNTELFIACNKTTSVVFPQIIKSIDKGSRDLLTQKISGAENILQLKAGRENFTETNMTVVTADGKLYVFTVHYAAEPKTTIIQADSIEFIYKTIARHKRTVRGPRETKYEMRLALNGLFIQNGILYFQLQLDNFSNISYSADIMRFFIKDRTQRRRTATQEIEQHPIYVFGNIENVPGKSTQVIVLSFPQFTIPDKKFFYIGLLEKNGGRNLRLKIKNKAIVRAKLLE